MRMFIILFKLGVKVERYLMNLILNYNIANAII